MRDQEFFPGVKSYQSKRYLLQSLFFSLLFFFTHISAQEADIERFVPREIPQKPGELLKAFPDESDLPADNTVLVEALTGLTVYDDIESFRNDNSVHGSGINLENLDFRQKDKINDLLSTYLGKPLSIDLLNQINQSLVEYFREHDRPVVDAFAPEGQDITEGIVKLVVLFGKRGEVLFEGDEEFSYDLLLSQIAIERDEILKASTLKAELDWLNQNPFRNVNLILQRGQEFGQTDLVFDVNTRRPYRFYGGLEDSGSGLTGKERWYSGFNWGNAFGLDHQLNYQFTSAFDLDVLNAHTASYIIPFNWRHTLQLFAAYVESSPDETPTGFLLEGKNWQLGGRYTIPLKSIDDYKHQVMLGYDFKRSNNNLEFGSLSVFDTYTTISQFILAYNMSLADAYGTNSGEVKLFISPGDMFSDNEDSKFIASRADASADYLMLRLNLFRDTHLPKAFNLHTEFNVQLSNENLLGSEQLGIGGYQTVRGYDDYAVVGDEGIVFKNEIHTPGFSLLKYLSVTDLLDQFYGLVFVDYGIVTNRQPLQGEESISLFSAGLGFRYTVSPYLSARFDYGWQLNEIRRYDDRDSRVHFGMTLAY